MKGKSELWKQIESKEPFELIGLLGCTIIVHSAPRHTTSYPSIHHQSPKVYPS